MFKKSVLGALLCGLALTSTSSMARAGNCWGKFKEGAGAAIRVGGTVLEEGKKALPVVEAGLHAVGADGAAGKVSDFEAAAGKIVNAAKPLVPVISGAVVATGDAIEKQISGTGH